MDIGLVLTIIGCIISILGIPSLIAWYTDYFPFLKRILYIMFVKDIR